MHQIRSLVDQTPSLGNQLMSHRIQQLKPHSYQAAINWCHTTISILN